MTSPSDQVQTSGPGGSVPPRVERYLGACGQLLGSIFPPLMTLMFDRAEENLSELADNATGTQLYRSYLDAARVLRQQQRDIQLNFFRLLRQGAPSLLTPPPEVSASQRGEPDSQELTLLQDAELEESLAIGNLTTKAESRYRPELLEMRFHLARLLGRERLPERSNPYGPFAICEAFRRALTLAHQVEPPIRLVVYKLFDRHLMDRLGDFYKGCVALAAADGHVPGSGFAHLLRRGSQGATPEAPAGAVLPQTVTLPFEALQGLLALQRTAAASEPARPVRVQTSELLAVLSNLGLHALSAGMITGESLRSGLTDALAGPGAESPALAREDEDTLDLVFLFFEHLLQGNDLPDPIKALIGRLQIPVAKLALLDKTFFSDQGHPARRLLNHMGEAAVGWSEDDDRGPDSLYGMIERVVERLILDFDGDPDLFAQMDRFFVAFIAREQSRSSSLEARSIAQLGSPTQELQESEQLSVARLVEDYLARYPVVPPAVESILREGWQPAMLATLRASGTDSSAWRRGLELADRLLWSVQPKVDAEDRRQLLRRIPEILRGLRTQLTALGSDQRQLARWFRDLQTLHLGVLQGEVVAPPPPMPGLTGGANAMALAVGSWVELQPDHGGKVRLKVAWVSPEGARYVFVDRRGRRGPELGRGELRALLAGGTARVLGDGQEPIADRALRSVLARLAG
ncbi:MAG: DUF1631 family protein [Bdellovibrio bacteriovorus]